MLQLITWMVFLGEIHVFLQLSRIGLFGAKRAYLHLETPKLEEVFLPKLTQFSLRNNVLDVAAYIIHGFLWRVICVSPMQLNGII
jgi:hypothetical protein